MQPRPSDIDYAEQRQHMVRMHLARRGIHAKPVLEAMAVVPREAFVGEHLRQFAYADAPLAIGKGQTISQPYIVALMLQALEISGGEHVLEVGTGSGYAAAVLAHIAARVDTVERIGSLATAAAATLARLGCGNVRVHTGDGSLGWPEQAPYDAIVVAAGGPSVPEPLNAQLAIGGRLVMPIGPNVEAQELVRVIRHAPSRFEQQNLGAVRFVPLLGAEAWNGYPRNGARRQN